MFTYFLYYEFDLNPINRMYM